MRYTTIGSGSAARDVSVICLGAMALGGTVDEQTSFAILDRFTEAGGTFVDTANNYMFWVPGCAPGQSEEQLGRWRAARGFGAGGGPVVATKIGARPRTPGAGLEDAEGLSAPVAREAAEGSAKRLGVDRLDVLYTHVEDRSVPLEETVGALADLVDEGSVGVLGVSNHRTWRVAQARETAAGRPGYEVLQYRYSYLQPRFDIALPEGGHMHASPELLDYVRHERAAGATAATVVYTSLLNGGYTRVERPLSAPYEHPGTARRLRALDDVVGETGATRNQVVLSWLIDNDPPMTPLVGVSSTGQLDEVMEAADLVLSDEQRRHLDAADTAGNAE